MMVAFCEICDKDFGFISWSFDDWAYYDQKTAFLIDVRGEPYYSESHIPGAISMTNEEMPSRLRELNEYAWIITYCTWSLEHSSAGVASYLMQNGFSHVSTLLGGLEAWMEAGYPVEK